MKWDAKHSFLAGMLFAVLALFFLTGTRPRIDNFMWNLRLQGNLHADSTICGQKAWANADTLDTLLVAGVDTNATVFLQALTSIENLQYTISSNNDTIFVEADSTQGTSDIYNYLVIWRQNYQEGN